MVELVFSLSLATGINIGVTLFLSSRLLVLLTCVILAKEAIFCNPDNI